MLAWMETMSISGYGFFEQTAFQTGVNDLDVRRLGGTDAGKVSRTRHHRRIGVRLPAVVSAFGFGFRPRQLTQRIQHADHVVSCRCRSASGSGSGSVNVVIGHGDDATFSEVSTTPRHVRVADNLRSGVAFSRRMKVPAGSLEQRRFVVIDPLPRAPPKVLPLASSSLFSKRLVYSPALQRIGFIRGDGDSSVSFTRDGVAQRAAVEIDQTQIQLIGVAGEEARQAVPVGVTQTVVNITAGVAASQPLLR